MGDGQMAAQIAATSAALGERNAIMPDLAG
jgi:hypothetical protein